MTILSGGVSAGFSLDGLPVPRLRESVALSLTVLIAIRIRFPRGNHLSRNRHGNSAGV